MTLPPDQKLPVTILTGFLGSGKTTLLNHLLHNRQQLKIAVLVNELGDIDIDSQLLVSVDEDLVQLSNGCICCTINSNLADAVNTLLQRRSEIDALVIETTGVADPLPIIMTFLGTDLRDTTLLDSVLTVLDASQLHEVLELSDVAHRQIAYGDILLLNKTDLVAPASLQELETHLGRIRRHPRILHCQHGHVDLRLILGLGLEPARFHDAPTPDPHHDHDCGHASAQDGHLHHHPADNDGFTAVSFESDRPFQLRAFQQWLDHHMPTGVYRAKGWIWFAESYKRYLFQLSGHRSTLEADDWTDTPHTQLVLIGRDLDPALLRQQLEDCCPANLPKTDGNAEAIP